VLTLTYTGANVLSDGGGGDPASLTVDGAGLVLNGAGQTNAVLMSRSTYGFCQGDLGAVGWSRIPIDLSRFRKI
jgi:hypothetical protein